MSQPSNQPKVRCMICKVILNAKDATEHKDITGHNLWEIGPKEVNMRIGLTVGFIGKEWEFYWGTGTGKYAIIEVAATILTVKISLFVKV